MDYKSFGPYCLSVVEGRRLWTTFGWPREHYLFIGRGAEAPGYGQFVPFQFFPGGDDVGEHIARSTVEWTDNGVTFISASGHRLYVPREGFVGGR